MICLFLLGLIFFRYQFYAFRITMRDAEIDMTLDNICFLEKLDKKLIFSSCPVEQGYQTLGMTVLKKFKSINVYEYRQALANDHQSMTTTVPGFRFDFLLYK